MNLNILYNIDRTLRALIGQKSMFYHNTKHRKSVFYCFLFFFATLPLVTIFVRDGKTNKKNKARKKRNKNLCTPKSEFSFKNNKLYTDFRKMLSSSINYFKITRFGMLTNQTFAGVYMHVALSWYYIASVCRFVCFVVSNPDV